MSGAFFFFLQWYLAKGVVQTVRGWVIQHARTYFQHCNQRPFQSQTNQAVYLQDYSLVTALQGSVPWREASQTFKTFLRAFHHLKNVKGCKNEKAQLPPLVSVSVRVSGLSALPSSFLSSSARLEGCLHFGLLTLVRPYSWLQHVLEELLSFQDVSVRLLEKVRVFISSFHGGDSHTSHFNQTGGLL